MSDIIKLLPDSIANQIAAGEVVQRPASVLKELLENAVDAGASSIKVLIKDAGKTLVQVVDDGSGMSETDARMCFERHATSKIGRSEDLFNIRTMGFRGEAMASIAAVAQVELKTKQRGEDLGTLIRIEGSSLKEQKETTCSEGTSVSVKNLFFNVPARRNFLKSNPVEMRHILDEFQRSALAFPDRAYSLRHNDVDVFSLASGNMASRIAGVFGTSAREQIAPCSEETPFMKVSGFIGKPEYAKKTRGDQFFFVNHRFVKHPYLHHAVMSAYEELLLEGSYPFYILFIEIDPKHIDINVHPTKTEIKFDDERTAYGIVKAAVRNALGKHHLAPSLDFDHNVNFTAGLRGERSSKSFVDSNEYKKFPGSPLQGSNLKHWEQLYDKSADLKSSEISNDHPSSIISRASEKKVISEPSTDVEPVVGRNSPFLLHGKYAIVQIKSGMMLVDVRAAYERILYEQYLVSLEQGSGVSQQCLFPVTVKLSPADFSLIMEIKDEIRALGFLFEPFGDNTVVVTGIPADVPLGLENEVLEEFAEQFKKYSSELKLSQREVAARALAKRAASARKETYASEEVNTLIDRLFACHVPGYTPDGRPTLVTEDLQQTATRFR